MEVPLSMMRLSIKQIYANEEWNHKVDMMHRNQVLAIYLRYKACRFNPERFKHKVQTAPLKTQPTTGKHTKYHCLVCGEQFVRDNPDLTECECCGSENILKELEK